MPYTLHTLPRDEEQAEKQCYVSAGDTAATAFGVPVLQHCVRVQERHLKLWEPTGRYYAISADPTSGAATMTWRPAMSTAAIGKTLLDLEAFVDLENFVGDYLPVYQAGEVLATAFGQVIPQKRESKLIAVYFVENGALRTRVIQVQSRGFGMGDLGAARSDPASEIEYLWWGNPAFGYSIGLDMARRVEGWIPSWSATSFDLDQRRYYRVPEPGSTPASASPTRYPAVAEVQLYKAFKGAADGLYASEAYVGDDARKRKKHNRPYQPAAPRMLGLRSLDAQAPGSYKTRVAKKRKGRAFNGAGQSRMEQDGGFVPAPGIAISRSGTGRDTMPKGPTAQANELVADEAVARALAGRGVALDAGRVRTDQETCHLLATSLTGMEEPYNFVLGSRHCNTEQLAIETALLFSVDPVRAARRSLKVKISAYLVPGTTMLADVIRYKVFLGGGTSDWRLLDHLIDAQSESFSYPEYRILLETVRRVVAVALGDEGVKAYEDRVNKRIADRRRAEGGGPELEPYYVAQYLKQVIG